MSRLVYPMNFQNGQRHVSEQQTSRECGGGNSKTTQITKSKAISFSILKKTKGGQCVIDENILG